MSADSGMTMSSREWLNALADAWDAGFDAAKERTERGLLLAQTVGVSKARRQVLADGPARNPYRIGTSGGDA